MSSEDTKPLLNEAPPPYPVAANNPYPISDAPPPLPQSAGYPPQQQPAYAPQPGFAPQPNAGYPGAASPTGYPAQSQQPMYAQAPPPTAYPVGYAPPGYGTYTPVVIGQPQPVVVAMAVRFSEQPQVMDCPFCQARISTRTEKMSGNLTYLACFGLFLFGCWPCCCIPFCLDSMLDVVHKCPNCSSVLGKYQKLK